MGDPAGRATPIGGRYAHPVGMSSPRRRILALNPHPDDEVLGAGATLLAWQDAGAEVMCAACGRGSDPARRAVREAEAREACRRAGWGFTGWEDEDLEPLLTEGWDLVVSPQAEDGHPAHARVGRAVEGSRGVARWWAWGLWAELAAPNLLVPFGADTLARLEHALAAHASEQARLDLRTLLRARAELTRVLGPERAFGFGFGQDAALDAPYAEALVERVRGADGAWVRTPPRCIPLGPDRVSLLT